MSKKLKDFRKKVRVVFEEAEKFICRLLVIYFLLGGSAGHSSDTNQAKESEIQAIAQAVA
ncbi:hypothetical protein LIS44_03705 [Acinetobacter haemolyticus]|jgi:hypothetical protein|uniref:hypothetical protein n=1 Tax=unclassified Acinetobacter TaxID=196816 RepID=UPI00140A4474|nr:MULTISPECIES: hypothetical protein [unclassified Acinetobacter]MDD2945259.1 hypothetical protein [Acinetobacter sp.]QQN38756.1 hypothetical protein JFY49_12255 [Acinetobacter sp. CS-2]UDM38872.1 hypothetical protein LIS44_03705 [Acinetobacter haemolyticus]